MTFARSILFNILFYLWTAVLCVGLLWTLVLPRRAMMAGALFYLRGIAVMERVVVGLDYRVIGRDRLPEGPCIVAAKHQSAWETLKLHLILDDPAPVLKRELLSVPVWGWYAAKADLIPVDRGGRSKAIQSMITAARRIAAQGRPIVIFPQGTRTSPGAWRPYRVGVVALYENLHLPVVPMALNSGLFWGRRKFLKSPGTVTVEFLDPIPPGLDRDSFIKRLESELETASERISLAAGGPATARPDPAEHAAMRREARDVPEADGESADA
ncbi:MAG: lysophospholipid acyltransferase family protein [Azospirillaceae bacterium]